MTNFTFETKLVLFCFKIVRFLFSLKKKFMKRYLKYLGYFLLLILGLIGVWAAINFKADIPIEVLKTKYATGTSKFAEIDGGNNGIINVHYRDEGNSADSIPLVLIHGTGSSLFTWDGWVKELGKDFRIIRLDLPAYGLTVNRGGIS